jgi:hypothetical protein
MSTAAGVVGGMLQNLGSTTQQGAAEAGAKNAAETDKDLAENKKKADYAVARDARSKE